MQRVRVYGEKVKVAQLVDALYDFGAIHVTAAKHGFIKEYGAPLNHFKDVSSALISLRTVEKLLGLKGKATDYAALPLAQLLEKCREKRVYEAIELNEQREKLLGEKANLERAAQDVRIFGLFGLSKNFAGVKSLVFTLFETSSTPNLLKTEFAANGRISVKQSNAKRFCLVAFDKNHKEAVEKIVAKHASRILPIPNIQSNSFQEEASAISQKISTTQQMIAGIEREMKEIRKNERDIIGLKEALSTESKKAQLPFNFAATNNLVAVEAWVPGKKAGLLEAELGKKFRAYVEFLKTNELAPTKMLNPKPLNSFEELVKFFSLPKSNELDPTPLVALSFPLFFGMIIGDIGHSLMALAAAYLIKLKMKTEFWQAAGTMLALSAVFGIIFGFIYAEFFGVEHIFGYHLTPLIHRLEAGGLETLMALVILFGILHLAVGYAVGAYQAFAHGDKKHGAAKLSWLVLEFSLVAFITGSLNITFLKFVQPLSVIAPPAISGPLLLLSVIGITVFEGLIAILEIAGLVSNIFSYLRIMALGVSAAIIALLLGKIPEAVSFADPLSIIAGALLLVLYVVGQVLAMGIAVFESMIQSMRLQYVEFFSKFFHGGGNPFVALNPGKDV
ncbi:hypothetical protein HY571_02365 [Candidatus Micrarchaeota archaeon]|nr:hypothetical protein [Candidatus Micrarchaeota archaeon]